MKNRTKVLLFALINILLIGTITAIGFISGYFKGNETTTLRQVVNIFTSAALFALLVVVAIEFASPFIVKSATFTTAFVALAVFLMLFTSSDTLNLLPSIGIDNTHIAYYYVFRIFNYGSFLFGLVFLYFFFKQDYGFKENKYGELVSALVLIGDYIVFIVLLFFGYSHFAFIPAFILAFYWTIYITHSVIERYTFNAIYLYSFLILTTLVGAELAEILNYTINDYFHNIGISAYSSITIILFFFLVYMSFTFKMNKEAQKNEINEKRLNELQNNVLKNQINPHFIFNTLAIIKSLYLEDPKKGSKAIDLFSQHLRAYVEAGESFLVPLSKELDIITSYVDLANLRGEKQFEVIYDIDFFDFEVPYFSLQPFIENALKYSKINEKEDGYIEIQTFEEEDDYMIIISDNGVGFDPTNVKSTSYGIKNSRERLRLLLGATVSIDSQIDKGSKITIRIPRKDMRNKE